MTLQMISNALPPRHALAEFAVPTCAAAGVADATGTSDRRTLARMAVATARPEGVPGVMLGRTSSSTGPLLAQHSDLDIVSALQHAS